MKFLKVILRLLLCLGALVMIGGLVAAWDLDRRLKETSIRRTTSAEMSAIKFAYMEYFFEHGEVPPQRFEDLETLLSESRCAKPVQEGKYVIRWGTKINVTDSGPSPIVLLYPSVALKQGGPVVMADGFTQHWTADQLRAELAEPTK